MNNKINENAIIFANNLITSNIKIVDILMVDALKNLNSAKNHEIIFNYFLLELLISIQKKRIEELFEWKYLDIIDEEYYNYLISKNTPKDVLNSMKISYQKKYDVYKNSIFFDELLSEKLFHLIFDFLSFIDVNKWTNYEKDDKEVEKIAILLLPFLDSTKQLNREFIFENYNI